MLPASVLHVDIGGDLSPGETRRLRSSNGSGPARKVDGMMYPYEFAPRMG